MKRICYVVLGLFLVSLLTCTTAPANRAVEKSSVWKISKDGNTLYLGGSVHILPKKTKIPGAFNKAFASADILVFEADVSEGNPAGMQSLQSRMPLPEGQTLTTVLSAESYQQLSEACASFGLSITQFEPLRPGAVLLMLSAIQLQLWGLTEPGADLYFMEQAKKKHKEMMFLESIDFQVDFLLTMFDEIMDEYVAYEVTGMEKGEDGYKAELEKMLNDWANGTNENTIQSNRELKAEFPHVYDVLLKDRNNAWVPIIEGYLETQPVEFVIVGVDHIHGDGEDGLLKQLEEAGYSVEQLR